MKVEIDGVMKYFKFQREVHPEIMDNGKRDDTIVTMVYLLEKDAEGKLETMDGEYVVKHVNDRDNHKVARKYALEKLLNRLYPGAGGRANRTLVWDAYWEMIGKRGV